MVRSLRRSWQLLLAVLAFAGLPADARAQTATQQREAAVLQARGGHMAEAQAALRTMLAAGTDDGLVAMDLTTLLQQDGKSAEARTSSSSMPSRQRCWCSSSTG
jgi:Flp pilus assembly protein TadD